MKYFMPVLGLVTIICIVVGTYIHVGGAFGGAFNIFDKPIISLGSGSDSPSGESDSSFSKSYENVDKLDIDMDFGNVNIIEGNELNVNFEGHRDLAPEVNVEDGKLKIRQNKKVKVNGLDLKKYKSELTVTIPSSANLKKVIAELDMGDLEISGFSCKELSADMSMGNLQISGVSADRIDVDNDMGDFEIRDSEFDKLDGNCDMGNISVKVRGSVDDYGISARCDLGRVSVDGDEEGNNFSTKGDKKITLKVAMGNIDVF